LFFILLDFLTQKKKQEKEKKMKKKRRMKFDVVVVMRIMRSACFSFFYERMAPTIDLETFCLCFKMPTETACLSSLAMSFVLPK